MPKDGKAGREPAVAKRGVQPLQVETTFTILPRGGQPPTGPTCLARDAASATLCKAQDDLDHLRDCYQGRVARRAIECLIEGLECAVEALRKLPVPPGAARVRP